LAAVTFNDHAANRQSQSYAMRLCREKRIKYAAQLFRIESWPRILNRNDNCIAIVERCSHLQHPISIGVLSIVLNCVLDQIRNDLLQLSRVTKNKRQL
jgi:hypothetical protein